MLPMATRMPDRVLRRGRHAGFDYLVLHNGHGFRCGYVRLPAAHPWCGREDDYQINVDCHGGVTWNGDDDAGYGRWLGWDYAHAFDAIDRDLPFDGKFDILKDHWPLLNVHMETLHTTDMVVANCESVCEQARAAVVIAGPATVAEMLARAVLAGDLSAADALADLWLEVRGRQ